MSNPLIPPLPLPDDDRATDDVTSEPGIDPVTVERDGERSIDPDVDDDQIDSADADRLASGAETAGDAL
ncbi:hypothetical protein [Microbacterium abyssi]|uniref:hypothetical protein n=1 Tax=Microbacterium abyssi TaxID=2782166 RepID=UPI0018870359|nr:hypothetical protein [Microbacterium sp. A18JL241]